MRYIHFRFWPIGPVLALIAVSMMQQNVLAQQPARLNVVLILADDLGAHDLGCTGSTFYETPNLDRLAKEGMLFTRAYAACPVCSPTRAAIMTGKYPPRTGITDFIGGSRKGLLLPAPYAHQLNLDEPTVAKSFQAAGYVTGMAGKWHLGGAGYGPEKQGFDLAASADPENWNGKLDRADRVTRFAVEFLDKNKDKPFFLYLPHNLPHIPLNAKPELIAKYQKKADGLPRHPEAQKFRPEGKSMDRRIQDHAVYAAMLDDLDHSVGAVLRKLDELGLAKNTLVAFTSDNGGLSTAEGSPTSNAPLRAGKGWLYEGGIREPLLVRWPGVVRPGSTSSAVACSIDFYPTLLEAAGVKEAQPARGDGVSLVPALQSSEVAQKRTLFWHYPHYSNQGGPPSGSILADRMKLIENFETGRLELFDLATDPGEQKDLAGDASFERTKGLLHEALLKWRADVGAKMPIKSPVK
jgi:arylsulfatase A-like enzyme